MKDPQAIIQLVDFALVDIRLKAPDVIKGDSSRPSEVSFEFAPCISDESPCEFRLYLTVGFSSGFEAGRPLGLDGSATIGGHFHCPDEIPQDQRHMLVLYNGSLILYGLLRGQIAAITGAFPTGKFMLPSVNMQQVIQNSVEKELAVAASSNRPSSKAIGSKTPKATATRKRKNLSK